MSKTDSKLVSVEPVDIPARLRQLRLQAGISQRTAAKAAHVAPGTWSDWERGTIKPRLMRLTAITKALDVPTGALDPPPGMTAIADVYLTAETANRVRQGGYPAAATAAQELAHALTPRIHAAVQDTTRTPTQDSRLGHPSQLPRARAQAAKARIEAKQQARNQAARLRADALASEAGGEGPNG